MLQSVVVKLDGDEADLETLEDLEAALHSGRPELPGIGPRRRAALEAVLAEAGLISQEKRGRVKWCKLEPESLRAASVWMQGFGQFDPMDYDAFERFLEGELAAPVPPPDP